MNFKGVALAREDGSVYFASGALGIEEEILHEWTYECFLQILNNKGKFCV